MRKWLRLVLATFGAGIGLGGLVGAGANFDASLWLAAGCVLVAVLFGEDWP